MKSRFEVFEEACKREFSFLESFGFIVDEAVRDDYGSRITYKNNTTAIRIELERALITIDCYKLKSGELPTYPIFFDPNQEFLIFDINDLLIVRTGQKVEQDVKRLYDQDYMSAKVKEFAGLIKRYAADVLAGDFAILPQIKERVLRRSKELEHEQ